MADKPIDSINKGAPSRTYSSSRDRIKSPSTSSSDRGSNSPRRSFSSPNARPRPNTPTPLQLRQGINSPSLTPLQKKQMLNAKRQAAGANPNTKLPQNTIMMMLALSIFLDAAEFLLDGVLIGVVLNPFIDLVAALSFAMWLHIRKVNIVSDPTAVIFWGGSMLELIFDGSAPFWTPDILAIIVYVRVKEKAEKVIPVDTAVGQIARKIEG